MNLVNKTLRVGDSLEVPAGVRKMKVTKLRVPRFLKNGSYKSLANAFLTATGDIYTVGVGTSGALGDGTLVTKSSPVLVVGGKEWKTMDQFTSSFYAIDTNNDVYAWGGNSSGQLGVGDQAVRSSPTLVLGGLKCKRLFTDIEDSAYALMLTVDGSLYGVGGNLDSRLGNGTSTTVSSPVLVSGSKKWVDVFAAASSVFAIDHLGDLYSWGKNTDGRLGHGDLDVKSTPTLVLGSHKVKKVTASDYLEFSFMILTEDGDLYGIGRNTYGQLGDGTVTRTSSPVLVLGGKKYVDVVSRGNGFLALDQYGDLYSWGGNSFGELGDGTSGNSVSSPVLVGGGMKWVSIASQRGQRSAHWAINEDGEVYTWGDNSVGYLGLNDFVARSTPTLLPFPKKCLKVSGSSFSTGETFAILSNGEIYAWGSNTNGYLGVGDQIPRSSPTLVLGAFKAMSPLGSFIETKTINVTPGETMELRANGSVLVLGEENLGSNEGNDIIEVEYFT